ncbi:hypothetical protein ARALYDRAFT_899046 [Arabidopsis lyrata subsp. lyrata]|uniref:F-box domain-containing protein n=1 Tax=Arabidopsis lyrata subsp. lyrata TaxID=81972 RepID=D7L558_ARALL|nr:putative F-box protein At3g24580 [Arabidopsis lyrata subsp. lyrata]EFH59795.1 hypothetical protein ARALYDRAFT_899046 [Arabidopsis lyrata subsp. lyrata]|eukprot:XP_002883536.1 putative F-box protein At3g24580 [Arabidopsis lyrata subsp. lyrata]
MTKMSNLPSDLGEEVLCRIPLTSLRKVRSTCKKWNTLFKGESFAKKYLGDQAKVAATEKEFMMVMMMDFRVYLMRVNLHNDVKSCIMREGELVSLEDEVNVSQVFHCDGLLLCIMEDNTRVVVWNPYWGQTRLIEPKHDFQKIYSYMYALGYEKSSKSCRIYKILRFIDFSPTYVEFKIYDINSNSWRDLDVITPYCKIYAHRRGVSVKGNTYWFARNRQCNLLCFDFTRERFGPCLPLPFQFYYSDTVSLSSVREEQLAVLFQCSYTLQMKIEPYRVSWNRKVFLAVDMNPLVSFQFQVSAASFFIDEENKVAVVFDKDKEGLMNPTRNVAYIVGVDGILEEVDLGVSAAKFCYPLVCSYVPSLVHL